LDAGALDEGWDAGALPEGCEAGALDDGCDAALDGGCDLGARPEGWDTGALPEGCDDGALDEDSGLTPPAGVTAVTVGAALASAAVEAEPLLGTVEGPAEFVSELWLSAAACRPGTVIVADCAAELGAAEVVVAAAEVDDEEAPVPACGAPVVPDVVLGPNTITGALNMVAHVRASITPVCVKPCSRWKSITAPRVSGPKIPSTARWANGSNSFSRRCAAATRGPWVPNSSTTCEPAVAVSVPLVSPAAVVPTESPLAAATAWGTTELPASAALTARDRLLRRRRARRFRSHSARR
jgi:hypothetical protein